MKKCFKWNEFAIDLIGPFSKVMFGKSYQFCPIFLAKNVWLEKIC